MPEQRAVLVYGREALERALPALSSSGIHGIPFGSTPNPGVEVFAALVMLSDVATPAFREARMHELGNDTPVVALAHDSELMGAERSDIDELLVLPLEPREVAFRLFALERHRRAARTAARERHDAEAMFELTQALSSSTDFSEILLTVVRRIAEVVNVSRASIVLSSGPNEDEVGHVVATSDDETVVNLELDLAKYPEIKEVLRSAMPLTIEDAHHHHVLDGLHPNALPPEHHSMLSLFPIISLEGEAIGVLFLRASRERGNLTARERHLCEVIATATAGALRNARAIQSLRDHSQRATFARFEAERQARSMSRYADLFAHVAEGIAACDIGGRVIFANPRAFEITGYDAQSIRDRRLVELVMPSDRPKARALATGFDQGHYPRAVDFNIIRANGDRCIVSCSFARVSEPSDLLLVSFRDVTEERATEEDLLKTTEFLESLVDASVDGIIAADMKGQIIVFNPAAERIYGYRQEEVIGRLNVRKLYPPGGAEEIMVRLRSEKWGGVGKLEPTRLDATSRDGATIPIQLSAAVIYEHGQPSATFGIFTDLREKMRTEAHLLEMQRKLELSQRQALIAELAGTAAHEMNQPLTSILVCLEMAQKRERSPESVERSYALIGREAKRLAEIVKNIGSITRYETTPYVGGQRILDLEAAQGGKGRE